MDKNSGFTIVELLVVIAIMSALIVASTVGWNTLIPGYRLNAAVNEIQTAFQMAKLKAIKENATTRVTLNGATGQYQAFVDDDEDGNPDTGHPVFVSDTLPMGVSSAGGTATVFTLLNNRGFPTGGGATNFRFVNSKGAYKGINISVAGSVVIQTSTDGVNWQDL